MALIGTLGSSEHLDSRHSELKSVDADTVQLEWKDRASLTISHVSEDNTHSYKFSWKVIGTQSLNIFKDIYDSSTAHWYGATAIQSQLWPIENWERDVSAYVTGDSFADEYGGVQERYWLSSNGIAIFVDKEVPLFVGMNNKGSKELVFISQYQYPYAKEEQKALFLNYSIIHGENIKSTHENVVGRFFPKPRDIPDERMFTHPIWSTWAMYKKDINETVVLDYAKKITEYGFSNSQIEIDDKWTPSYGLWDFDRKKFPDPKRLIETLTGMGFRTTLWVHPFATPFTRPYWSGIAQHRWMSLLGLPALGTWWNGLGASLDVTDERAVEWFLERLKYLQVTRLNEYDYDIFHL